MSVNIRQVDSELALYGKIRRPSKWACWVKGYVWRLLDAGNFRSCDRCGQKQLRRFFAPGDSRWRNV